MGTYSQASYPLMSFANNTVYYANVVTAANGAAVITVACNGTVLFTTTDTTPVKIGYPGIGAYWDTGSTPSANNTFAWKAWSGGSL